MARDDIKITSEGRIALTTEEIGYLRSLVSSGDRLGFYTAYYNITGSRASVL